MSFLGLSKNGWIVYFAVVVIGLINAFPLGPGPAAAVGGLAGVLIGAYIITMVGVAIFGGSGGGDGADAGD